MCIRTTCVQRPHFVTPLSGRKRQVCLYYYFIVIIFLLKSRKIFKNESYISSILDPLGEQRERERVLFVYVRTNVMQSNLQKNNELIRSRMPVDILDWRKRTNKSFLTSQTLLHLFDVTNTSIWVCTYVCCKEILRMNWYKKLLFKIKFQNSTNIF